MKTEDYTGILPAQYTGKEIIAEANITFDNIEQARQVYDQSKQRLLDVDNSCVAAVTDAVAAVSDTVVAVSDTGTSAAVPTARPVTSDFVLANVSVRSPRKNSYFHHLKTSSWIKAYKKYSI